MSGGYRAQPTSDVAFLLAELNRMKERISTLERTRGATIVGLTSNSVIIADSSGAMWRLGVTTAGATTWTSV